MFIVLSLTLLYTLISPSFQGPREYPLPALLTKSRNDFVAGFLRFVWHKFAEMSECRWIEVFSVQIMRVDLPFFVQCCEVFVLHFTPLCHGAMWSGVLCVVVVVDVGRGLTVRRLLMGAQAWNNYYWLVERYWREYVNYLRKLRIHAQKTKSRSKEDITLKRQNHAQKTKSRFLT